MTDLEAAELSYDAQRRMNRVTGLRAYRVTYRDGNDPAFT